MNDTSVQTQINEINNKLDLLLEYVNQQRLKSESVDDLISDISIIGKDIYDTTVAELDDSMVEIDPEAVKIFLIKILKNVNNFSMLLEFFESMNDLLKEVKPIANEVVIDITKKFHEFEVKGYFEFMKESAHIIDNIITHFSKEDISSLADNIVGILETVKDLTQPDMLNALNNATMVFKSMDVENIPEYSIFQAARELRTPEMKKGMGFIITFLKNMAKLNN